MRINSITIENFKGIRDRVKIDLKSITLLFGANSAGKSTIIQALHYAVEVFECHNLNADRTLTGGDSVGLGGFRNIVHNHDTQLPIKLRFDFRFASDEVYLLDHLDDGLGSETPESDHYLHFYYDMAEAILEIWLEVTINWSSVLGSPIITSYKTGFGDRLFAEITHNENKKNPVLTYLDLQSPVFIKDGYNFALPYLAPAIRDEENNILQMNIEGTSALPGLQKVWFPDLYNGHPDGIPSNPMFKKPDSFRALLSSLLISPVNYLREQLQNFRYIGPLRKVPNREYKPDVNASPSRWSDGLAGWDELHKSDPSFINKINDWLFKKLKTGYGIEIEEFKKVYLASSFAQAVLQGRYIDENEGLQKLFASLPTERRLFLRAESQGLKVSPADIGVGISQVIPVIVLALAFQEGILAIEQPELHIHPALQVALGDLFIEQIISNNENNINGGKIFLLETHSEHLLLRIMRRMRETCNNKLPEGIPPLTPEDVCVLFVEQLESRTIVREMPLNKKGELVKAWPGGFFEESFQEVF